MSKEQKSLVVWVFVLVTVVSAITVFVLCLPNFSKAEKILYDNIPLPVTTTSQDTVTTTQQTQKEPLFPLNINTATKEELICVPGIGDVYATRIIAFREQHGGFSALEQLTEIKGIGEKRLQAFREYLICE